MTKKDKPFKLSRAYLNNGKNISTKLKNTHTGKEYLVSTATDNVSPVWQIGVLAYDDGAADPYKPLLFDRTFSFEEAEKLHIATEKLVAEQPESDWVQQNIPMLGGK